MLVDTHCHIHDDKIFPLNSDETIERALQADVTQMLCIGTDEQSSLKAIEFAESHDDVAFAAIGVHPHEAKNGCRELEKLIQLGSKKLVAIGEIGLDYHYDHSPRDVQIKVLQAQIELALKYNLPIIFHVREAYDDFWPILDNFQFAGQQIRGVLHSFTDSPENAEKAIKRGLYVGINGFSTFTKDIPQQQMFATLPLDKILLETDAPFLTPVPFRGKINEPAFVRNIAMHQSLIRNISINEIASQTTENARALFGL
ncbi:MAG: TatD family hydrolase [Candidatus Saccharimonadales bacterium]